MSVRFVAVAVPVPLAGCFTYSAPESFAAQVVVGSRVLCEFGRRRVLWIVVDTDVTPDIDVDKIKPLRALIDAEPALPLELLEFLRELAAYYFAPLGEVLRLAMPAVERKTVKALTDQGALFAADRLSRTRRVGGRQLSFASATDKVEQPGALRGQAAAILALLRATGEIQVSELAKRFGNARAALKKLSSRGLVALEKRAVQRAPLLAVDPVRDAPPELNEAQRAGDTLIGEALERAAAGGFLLFGVTGSGKTEVYMHAIARCLDRGRGALVLVPEIALTPQLLGRFRARFGDAIALLHSGLAEADRHQMWQRLRAGELRVAIGARSALFAPVDALGLVVVDEEHDGSFKQEEGVRYHARDMALLRAHRAGAVTILGSATPSLEAMALVERGKLTRIDLPERAHHAARMPHVDIIDLKHVGAGPTGHRLLTHPLHQALETVLAAGEQAIIFLNRRGFAPSVVCDRCGTVTTCPACSVALTFHQRRRQLRCHYCDYGSALPDGCADCRGELKLEGVGTEKLEQAIGEAFADARIGRLDRDVAAGAKSQRILDRMRSGELDILVGTQMVTKGHDLPNVTLVGVVNADAALSLPDFRAAERGFQLLVQVAGRAGRAERGGRVLVQTRDPKHPAVRHATHHDVAGFLSQELRDRRELRYPPFSRLALVRIDAVDENAARKAAARLAADARSTDECASRAVEVLGPAPAPIARLRARYRFRVMLRSTERGPLRAVVGRLSVAKAKMDRRIRVAIDIDPVSML